MPIQRFGKLVAAAASGITANEASTSQWIRLNSTNSKRLAVSEGLHRISVYSTNVGVAAQSDVSWKFFASNQTTELQSGSVQDQDTTSQNELDPWAKIVFADQDGYLQFSIATYLNVPMYVHVESLPYSVGLAPNLITYNSTQSFVVPENASKILIIGGGGGGGAAGNNQGGSGGGGSGYIQVFTSGFSVGQTLSLTAGAGGAGGAPGGGAASAGGTTSIAGLGSASGGQPGVFKGSGGNGGSGGGGAQQSGAPSVGGAGGYNGGAGGNGPHTAGGSGSGVQTPVEIAAAPAAGPSNYSGGAGGGFYGGGAGGGSINTNTVSGRAGGAAIGLGGGGGGGGGGNNGSLSYGGGNGADGGAIILAGWA